MTDELVPQEPVLTPELQEAIAKAMDAAQERATIDTAPITFAVPQGEPFVITPELQAAIDAAIKVLAERTYAGRNPELGKMVNCAVCHTRHRKNVGNCEQVFTYRVGDFELFRENEEGQLVPDYRTCTKEGERPTMKQVMGAAAFNKRRFHPHHSKIRLLFIQRTREVFAALGFSLERTEEEVAYDRPTEEKFNEFFDKNLQRARVVAARQLRKERGYVARNCVVGRPPTIKEPS
jgi:hypothetical protein